MHRHTLLLGLSLLLAAGGCGQGNSSPQEGATPDQNVTQFLESIRRSETDKAAQFLTPTARQKTAETQMVLSRPGSPSATFTISGVEYVGDNGAYVGTLWTDTDEDGEKFTDKVVWILRKESEGWRITGMATKLFDDQPAIILNFEDPADMLRKHQLAEQEAARRAQAPSQQARKSGDVGQKSPR